MVTFAIGIVAHESRLDQASALLAATSAEVISIDDGKLGCTGNHLHVLKTLATLGAEWVVVLEDDALPCPNFRDHLAQVLTDAPSPVVSLYLGTGRWAGEVTSVIEPHVRHLIDEADATGSTFIEHHKLWHAVAYAIRSDMLADVIDTVSACRLPIDQGISRWLKVTGNRAAYSWPSHVDHEDGERTINTGDIDVPRKAWKVE